MTDSITDLFNRIKNAEAVHKEEVIIPVSKLNFEVLQLLKRENFIENCEKENRRSKKVLLAVLKYNNKIPGLLGFKRVSKPGQRLYAKKDKIPKVKQGYGIAVISTSRGLMTDKEARKQKIGGELLVEVW